MQLVCQLRASQ